MLWITYDHLYYLLAYLFENSLVHWYQQCLTVHQVSKCMSCHKVIVVITGRKHCFHDNIYIMLILLLWNLRSTVSWITYDHFYLYIYIYILCECYIAACSVNSKLWGTISIWRYEIITLLEQMLYYHITTFAQLKSKSKSWKSKSADNICSIIMILGS